MLYKHKYKTNRKSMLSVNTESMGVDFCASICLCMYCTHRQKGYNKMYEEADLRI